MTFFQTFILPSGDWELHKASSQGLLQQKGNSLGLVKQSRASIPKITLYRHVVWNTLLTQFGSKRANNGMVPFSHTHSV